VRGLEDDEKRKERHRPEDIREVLSVVSTEVPGLIKSILSSVFSEEAGKNMGKAAAAYYKELKDGGLPEQVAVKMTEDYMKTFTSLGDMLRSSGRYGSGSEIGKQIEKRVREKIEEKAHAEDEDREEEE
jgi:hypothetical protein